MSREKSGIAAPSFSPARMYKAPSRQMSVIFPHHIIIETKRTALLGFHLRGLLCFGALVAAVHPCPPTCDGGRASVRHSLPVRITAEAPDLYMICKENDHAISVGLWNFSLDAVPQQELLLAKAYTDAEFLNCTGRLNGKKIILPEMQPYSFAGFTMKKPTSER